MTTQQLATQRLSISSPMFFATGLLSAGLLLSGCSDNNQVENQPVDKTTDSSAAVDTLKNTKDTDTDIAPDMDKTANTPHSDTAKADADIVSQDISPIAAAVKEPSILTNRTQVGTPEHTVKLALDTLYYGDVKKAASYYKVDMENFDEELKNTQFAFKQTVEAVTIIDTKYNSDKTKATVTGELRLKGQSEPAPLAYDLQKINGEWKILG